jgi:hypothetical protein
MNRKYNNIDDLFRDKFDDYEVDPPDYIWENVKTRIGNSNGNGGITRLRRGGITGITLLAVAIGVTSFFLMNNNPVSSEELSGGPQIQDQSQKPILVADNQPATTTPAWDDNQPSALAENSDQPGKENKEDRRQGKKMKVRGNNPKRNATLFLQPDLTSGMPAEREAQAPLAVEPFKATPFTLKKQTKLLPVISRSERSNAAGEMNITTTPSVAAKPGADMVRGQNSPEETVSATRGIRSDYGADGRWVFGLYFTPEILFYPSDDQLKNYSYSLDLHASYRLGNYFIQSGFGFARNHEQGNSTIDYNKYMGSYEDVYDVTFDTTENGVNPVYHTETVYVYDSVSHVVISPSKRYFTYFQLPFFIGYGQSSKRFGWFVKGGPSLSFLVHENIPAAGSAMGNARIINVENELPARISTNWQFIVSAGATYKLGSRVSLSMEPMLRYYVNSVYEQGKLNTKHPFSVGLRTGLLLNF